jgi:hypothetical protein
MSTQSDITCTRSAEEDVARGRCRALVHRQGSKLFKIRRDHVAISPCGVWPEGLVTAYNGWQDLLTRLHFCLENPEYVTEGVYVQDYNYTFEAPSTLEARRMAEEIFPDVDRQSELPEHS